MTIFCRIESLMLSTFKNVPFHNLFILNKKDPLPYSMGFGGTCSDKTLDFFYKANELKMNPHLHIAEINGELIHRLVRFVINGECFFADVGNGWPALKLIPAHYEIDCDFFGMPYRTKINNGKIFVYHAREKRESLQMVINPAPLSQSYVIKSITKRFSSGIIYPFSHSVRFAKIVDEKFLFLRGKELFIYSDNGVNMIRNIKDEQMEDIIEVYFKMDPNPLFSYLRGKETQGTRKNVFW